MATNNSINLRSSGIVSYNGSGTFAGRTLTAGNASVLITNGDGIAGNPTFSVQGGGLPWTEVTGTSQSMAVNNGYILNNVGLVTATLPSTAAVGSIVRVAGKGTGGWTIAQNSGQTIHIGNQNTTTGTGGSLSSTNQYDGIALLCTTANTDWVALDAWGNLLWV